MLAAGLVFGWLRARHPTFGRVPPPALWVFEVVGLATFLAAVGLSAGPAFVAGLAARGPELLAVGAVVTLVPHVVTLLSSRVLFPGLPAGVVLGACAGAGGSATALAAVEEEAGSRIPALGYTVPYAVGTILLTFAGPAVVALVP